MQQNEELARGGGVGRGGEEKGGEIGRREGEEKVKGSEGKKWEGKRGEMGRRGGEEGRAKEREGSGKGKLNNLEERIRSANRIWKCNRK